MQRIKDFWNKNRTSKIVIILVVIILFCCTCSFFIAVLPDNESASPTLDANAIYTEAVQAALAEFQQEEPTLEPQPTTEPEATNTPEPTNTPIPAPTQNPNLIAQGTYLVGTNIQPGLYLGQAGEGLFGSCYWERLSDLSGDFEAILANENSTGKYYIEVKNSDLALTTDCDLTYLPTLPTPLSEFPTNLDAGTYLVGIDVQSGTYQGQAGTDILESCYWARLSNVAGNMDAIIANDNANGQYYIQVQQSDFAFSTACSLVRIGD